MSESLTETKQLPKDIAAEKGMVNVQIDGHWIQVPRGTRMIEACKIAEKEVPHYYYHPKLSSPGNCRMCLVQMGMPPRLAPGQDPEFNTVIRLVSAHSKNFQSNTAKGNPDFKKIKSRNLKT